jgi:hypothetical protein
MTSGIYTTTKHRGRPIGSGECKVRYINPITGIASPQSWYLDEQGIKKRILTRHVEHLVDNKWGKPNLAPHVRKTQKKYLNTKKGFMLHMLSHMKEKAKEREKKGRKIQGENEFMDNRRGRCDKFMAHYDKQVERYGDKCPMTHIPFTMGVPNDLYDVNNQTKIFSNVSPDRIFNNINYTEQNTIFTSQLWNLTKRDISISKMMLIFKPEIIERYKAIVMERFPDQEYVL